MKTGMELVKEIRAFKGNPLGDQGGPFPRGFDAGMAQATRLLQAWLREADKAVKGWKLIRLDDVDISNVVFKELRKDFRGKILGTTRQEGEK